VFGAAPKAFPSYVGNSTWHWGSVAIDPQSIATIGGCIAMVVLLEVWLRLTTSGRAVRAVAQDGDAARSVGINANRMILAATAVSCAIAGAAGILLGPTTFVSFNMGIPISLLGFSAAIVGGLGSVRGAVIGGLALGVAEQILTSYVSTVYTEALLYAVVVVVLITRPQGLLREAAL
jgi:branched-chain amino acid transport system permease protein